MSFIPTKEQIQTVYDNIARSREAKAKLEEFLLNPTVDDQSKADIRSDLRQYNFLCRQTTHAENRLCLSPHMHRLRNGCGTIEDWDACRQRYRELQKCETNLIRLLNESLGTVGLSWWYF